MGTRQLAQYAGKAARGLTVPFFFAGVPTSGAGGTMAAYATVGSALVDTVNGDHYMCIASGGGSVTWQLTAVQT
jgi:hypothetical protein